MAGNLLADLESKALEVEETEEVTEETEETEESETPETEETEETEESETPETEETEEEAAGPPELDEEMEFLVDGEVITGAELKKSRLRQADYTKKTQELAEIRKAVEAQADATSDYEDFLEGIKDVEVMEMELERYYPQTLAALRERIIEQALEEQEATTDVERDRIRRLRKAELGERATKRDTELDSKRRQRKEQAQKTAELRKTYATWALETMAAAGLDPNDEDHLELVRESVKKRKGETWTKETFAEAAKRVGKMLGKAPPAPKKGAIPPKKKAAEAKLPPGKGKAGQTVKDAKAPVKKKPAKDAGSFFQKLRKEAGLPL